MSLAETSNVPERGFDHQSRGGMAREGRLIGKAGLDLARVMRLRSTCSGIAWEDLTCRCSDVRVRAQCTRVKVIASHFKTRGCHDGDHDGWVTERGGS